ncbi:hydroxyisourate hydrolase [Marinovum sp.]|uniref:hydroxyisourate hydrolase n=1 Tax=Marinovum sp. TaxID=2024839 RepID=UPI002B277AC6|nr:hydroxyisourate hydrolase [Marinovum sp.]
MEKPDINRRSVLKGIGVGATGLAVLQAASGQEPLASRAHAAEHASGGKLTLHAIDTYYGQTRAGLQIDLSMQDEEGTYKLVKTVETVERGRTEAPLLEPGELNNGRFELLLHFDDYYQRLEAPLPTPPFLAKVPIRFGVFDAAENFHVPILFNPWNYSYYRGS